MILAYDSTILTLYKHSSMYVLQWLIGVVKNLKLVNKIRNDYEL